MELQELERLLHHFDKSGAASLKFCWEGGSVVLKKPAAYPAKAAAPLAPAFAAPAQPNAAPAGEADEKEAPGEVIAAPLVGTFYAAPSPEAAPFAAVGQTVKKGRTVCLIEAMKMMSEVPAPADCVVEAVLAQDGGLVEFGAPLFAVRFL